MLARLDRKTTVWSRAVAAVSLMAAALVAVPVGPAVAARGQAGTQRSTPELLDDAVARGEIDQRTADVYLARVFAGRGVGADVPARLQGDTPWRGTLPLLRLKQRLAARPDGPSNAEISGALAAATTCYESVGSLPNETVSTHFYLNYGTIGGGLSATTYLNSLEGAWSKEVTSLGWAAPPVYSPAPPAPIGTKYVVRAVTLGGGLYGLVSPRAPGPASSETTPTRHGTTATPMPPAWCSTRTSPATRQVHSVRSTPRPRTSSTTRSSSAWAHRTPRTTRCSRVARRGWRTRSTTRPTTTIGTCGRTSATAWGTTTGTRTPSGSCSGA